MARKVARVTIVDEGRDKGKVFVLTEMPASRAEKWAMRALLAMSRSGVDIPNDAVQSGMLGVAAAGVQSLARLQFFEAEELMDEMFGCITIQPDPEIPTTTRPLIEDDIEEVATRLKLRWEVLQLHVNFSVSGLLSRLRSATSAAQD
jgi:hypothetical protein